MRIPGTVIHEHFEDEVVVLNMQTGHYFSMVGPSAELWSAIHRGADRTELERHTGASNDTDSSRAVDAFLSLLGAEGLVDLEGRTGPAIDSVSEWLEPTCLRGSVEKFTDAEGLLLLDPIHEVDEAGWPSAAQ